VVGMGGLEIGPRLHDGRDVRLAPGCEHTVEDRPRRCRPVRPSRVSAPNGARLRRARSTGAAPSTSRAASRARACDATSRGPSRLSPLNGEASVIFPRAQRWRSSKVLKSGPLWTVALFTSSMRRFNSLAFETIQELVRSPSSRPSAARSGA
jgi:hypothetical protein